MSTTAEDRSPGQVLWSSFGTPQGRRPKLSDAKAATVRRMYQATGPDGKRLHTVAEIAQTVGIHRTTVYDYLKKEG